MVLRTFSGDPPSVAAGATPTIKGLFPTPGASSNYIAAREWTTLDYQANSQPDGNGTDLTVFISIVASMFNTEITLEISNGGSENAYLTLLRCRGFAIIESDPVRVSREAISGTRALFETRSRASTCSREISLTDRTWRTCLRPASAARHHGRWPVPGHGGLQAAEALCPLRGDTRDGQCGDRRGDSAPVPRASSRPRMTQRLRRRISWYRPRRGRPNTDVKACGAKYRGSRSALP
jgi:hypothetical protein